MQPCLQVFFYFSGHGGNLRSDTQIMYGNDGTAVSFYELFYKEVASKGCPVIAVLDCCRDIAKDPVDILVSVCSCINGTYAPLLREACCCTGQG